MKDFIYSLMTDKRKGVIYTPFKLLLLILSVSYGLAIFIRMVLYKTGIFKTSKVPLKIISVGNLTLGGTGKTPFVVKLAGVVKANLKKDASILIRGYGWDEQAMLKKNLPDNPILVGEDRVKQAHRAIKLYGSEVAILDDGFQYWELERDLNIVLIDSHSPYGNGYLFPRGILRETKNSIKRADIVVFTKINKKTVNLEEVKRDLNNINERLVFLEAFHKPKNLYDVKSRRYLELQFVNGKRVILLSSIGDPEYFEMTVKDLNANVIEHLVFPDHHNYREKDIANIMKRCSERRFDFILTTEKDLMKLSRMSLSFKEYALMTLMVELEIKSGEEILLDRLHSLYNR